MWDVTITYWGWPADYDVFSHDLLPGLEKPFESILDIPDIILWYYPISLAILWSTQLLLSGYPLIYPTAAQELEKEETTLQWTESWVNWTAQEH